VRTTFSNDNVRCPSCVAVASRESVYSVNFGGFARTPGSERDYRTDYKNFNEAGAELEYQHARLQDATQTELPPPPLYQMAKAKAKDLRRKGATANDLS
jgi:predicted nucleotidyltransferase